MQTELEFYLLKIYKRPNEGWRVSLCEIQNFNNGANWYFACLDRSPKRLRLSFFGA